MTDDQEVVLREVDGMTIRTQTPGEWLPIQGGKAPQCKIPAIKHVGRLPRWQGRALLVADADLLDTPYWEGQGCARSRAMTNLQIWNGLGFRVLFGK